MRLVHDSSLASPAAATHWSRASMAQVRAVEVDGRVDLAFRPRVRVKNVGVNAFSLVATLFWLYMLHTGRNMLVSGVWAVHLAPEQHV